MFNKDEASRYFNPKLSGWALLSREVSDNYESSALKQPFGSKMEKLKWIFKR